MLILEQNIPFRLWTPQSTPHVLAPILDADLARRSPEGIGAGKYWVGQDIVHGVVGWQPPDDAAPLGIMGFDGQCDAFVPQPDVHLTNALELGELGEDQLQCILDPLVGILLDPVAPDLHITSSNAEEQRTTPRLLLQRLVRALPKQRQLQFAHRTLHPEQQSIIGMPRIIDSVLLDDDRAADTK